MTTPDKDPTSPVIPLAEFDEVREWHLTGNGFHLKVWHTKKKPIPGLAIFDDEGRNRWCVYAYIYPNHPRFKLFKGDDLYQPATREGIYLHRGCSFCRTHQNEKGEITSYQIGSDYNHLHDNNYTFLDTAEDALQVFEDATTLYRQLNKEYKDANPENRAADSSTDS